MLCKGGQYADQIFHEELLALVALYINNMIENKTKELIQCDIDRAVNAFRWSISNLQTLNSAGFVVSMLHTQYPLRAVACKQGNKSDLQRIKPVSI